LDYFDIIPSVAKDEMFRRVDLPAPVPGSLLLHSMPGRYEAIESVWSQVKRKAVAAIICLAEQDEIHEKSFEYAQALEEGTVPCLVLPFEIPDRGAPEDRHAFWALAGDIAERLQRGENVLIHCAGGVGRTAMLAVCVLLALGEPASNARRAVSRAGSTVETAPQSNLISWCALKKGRGA
jgi:protein-tyrosine phosphatase